MELKLGGEGTGLLGEGRGKEVAVLGNIVFESEQL